MLLAAPWTARGEEPTDATLPQVNVITLEGTELQGSLLRLESKTLTLGTPSGEMQVPLANLLDVQFSDTPQERPVDQNASQIQLVDGSRFHAKSVTVDGEKALCETWQLGSIQLPATALGAIRFSVTNTSFNDEWNKLLMRELSEDMLVLQKDDVLDHLDGVVGQIDDKGVNILFDNDPIAVPRSRVFGVIYFRRKPNSNKAVCRIKLENSQLLEVKQLSWDGKRFGATLLAGTEITIPAESLRSLDFSLGKLAYLSDMEPREVKYTPFFDVVWEYRRDRNLDGGPIRLGNKAYSRGLALHSRTLLRYRLGGEYRRFQTVVGIDQVVAPNGHIHLVIKGDDKPLFEADVAGTDDPKDLELDVTGVRDLEILVDFGSDLDISDHLDLADAKVIK